MVIATGEIRRASQTDEHRPLWFTTFLLVGQTRRSALKLRCVGCRELIKLDYKKPTHIRGIIEFNGIYIPVIDPGILLLGQPTKFNNLSCMLVIPHRWEYQQLHTGIFIEDIDEIMEFASSGPDIEPLKGTSVNMKFILDMCKNPSAGKWLYENHLALNASRGEKQNDLDYIAFKRVCLQKLPTA